MVIFLVAAVLTSCSTSGQPSAETSQRLTSSQAVLAAPVGQQAQCGWKVENSATIGNTVLSGLSADNLNDIWAVGFALPEVPPTTPVVEHFNGANWTVTSAVGINNAVTEFTSVSALGPNNVWAAGSFFFPGPHILRTLSEHWDGTAWKVVPTVNPVTGTDYAILSAILAIGPNDAWAAGVATTGANLGHRPQGHTLIEHWNGSTWTVVASPDLGGGGFLHGLAGTGTNDVWAVGDGEGGVPLAEHWDGLRWSIVQMQAPNAGVVTLHAVTEVAANDVWAVGSVGLNSDATFTEHWNGSSWTIVPSPHAAGEKDFLIAVSHTGRQDVWAAGYTQSASAETTLAMHWNGSRWTVAATKNPVQGSQPLTDSFAGIVALSPKDVFAAGRNFASSLVEEFCR